MSSLSRPLSRRRLFELAASAAVAWQLAPWTEKVAGALSAASPGSARSVVKTGSLEKTRAVVATRSVVETLEAFSDTLIPGAKRWPGDRAIAGAAPGAGAVQAGAIEMMQFPPAGIAPALAEFAALLDARAETYAAQHSIVLDPTVAPMVALDFDGRTELLLELLAPAHPDFEAWFALAAMPFLAFHTAGFLHTADAMRDRHPGLEAIGFPPPGRDGRWRFEEFSYRRRLAETYPGTSRSGSPP